MVVEVVWCNGSGSGYEMLVASNVVHSIIRWAYLARKTYYNYKAAGIEQNGVRTWRQLKFYQVIKARLAVLNFLSRPNWLSFNIIKKIFYRQVFSIRLENSFLVYDHYFIQVHIVKN